MKDAWIIKNCVDCELEKYLVVLTEIDKEVYICDECLEKREKKGLIT